MLNIHSLKQARKPGSYTSSKLRPLMRVKCRSTGIAKKEIIRGSNKLYFSMYNGILQKLYQKRYRNNIQGLIPVTKDLLLCITSKLSSSDRSCLRYHPLLSSTKDQAAKFILFSLNISYIFRNTQRTFAQAIYEHYQDITQRL